MFEKIKYFLRDLQEFRLLRDNLELPDHQNIHSYIYGLQTEIKRLNLRLDPNTQWGTDHEHWTQVEPGLYVAKRD